VCDVGFGLATEFFEIWGACNIPLGRYSQDLSNKQYITRPKNLKTTLAERKKKICNCLATTEQVVFLGIVWA
jgi:hypothetical protein